MSFGTPTTNVLMVNLGEIKRNIILNLGLNLVCDFEHQLGSFVTAVDKIQAEARRCRQSSTYGRPSISRDHLPIVCVLRLL